MVIESRFGEVTEECPLPGCRPGEEGSGTSPGGGVDCNGIDSNGDEPSPASSSSPVMMTGVDTGIVGLGAYNGTWRGLLIGDVNWECDDEGVRRGVE